MEESLLYVLHAVVRHAGQIGSILRAARQACPSGSMHTLLLLCDLPDAGAAVLPDDAPMLRRLQSGIMSMNARSASQYLLLVRKRSWDDAQRLYLGEHQPLSFRHVVAQLLTSGETDAVFEVATVSPSSLKERFSHVLFSDVSLACTPDTPVRMLEAQKSSSSGCIGAHILEKKSFPQTVLMRLLASSPFSLSPLLAARYDDLQRKKQCLPDAPALYTANALSSLLRSPAGIIPAAQDCFFVRRHSLSLRDCFAAYRQFCLKGSRLHALLPPLQIALLFFSAALGLPWIAALALVPAELWSLWHPRLLPGALLRLSLLPLTACVSVDALLCRLFARSRFLRLHMPASLIAPHGAMLFASALLPAAIYGAHALVFMMPVCLLWFAAPIIIPAIDAPSIERIPLDPDQRRQMRTLAENAFFDSESNETSAPMRMLSLCGGCMLGLLEPDEAARQIEKKFDALKPDALPAPGFAAMLCAAQYLREHMSDCDAALRELPAKIENTAIALSLEKSSSKLALFFCAARGEISSAHALARFSKAEEPEPLDLLFLPLSSAKAAPVYPLSLPLTHPHTFLHRQLFEKDTPVFLPEPPSRFLFLAASALNHPFFALLERSPVAGPFMPLLSV